MRRWQLKMQNAHGEIIIYQAEDGQTKLQVHLEKESVWLTQAQLTELFDRNKRTISEHIRNVFKEGELVENAVVRKFRTTASDGKSYDVIYYNLDVIISVGYRVKSQRGTQFRIWATTVLKEHLIKGYTVSERRLAEKGLSEMEQTIALLSNTLERREVLSEEEEIMKTSDRGLGPPIEDGEARSFVFWLILERGVSGSFEVAEHLREIFTPGLELGAPSEKF